VNREDVRKHVWSRLIEVAKPDSRFHLDFNEYIPDFEGSELATEHLLALSEYQASTVLFVTPDNCLELLRAENVRRRKLQIVTTYGIRRGFLELRPDSVPPGIEEYAVLLDSIERFATPISLSEIRQRYRFDLLVTGASAVSMSGVRFGKGHGFFDLEWAMLYEIGAVHPNTPIAALIHDCQVVDAALDASPHDVVCDIIVTPTRTLRIPDVKKPTTGVVWERLTLDLLRDIPVLNELKLLRADNP
jgi:5-formyltetrahydrofolate cyclo-ligase